MKNLLVVYIINRHPEEGQAQGLWNVMHLPCPDVGIYRCLGAVDNVYDAGSVILNEVKNLLAVSTPCALTLVGFEEMLRYAQHDSL